MPDVHAGPPSLLWSINARAVLEAIDRDGPLARPELTRATGLSKTTVAQTLAELEQRGIVINAGVDDTRRGPAATLYDLNARATHGLAVDIGHHRVRVTIVDARGRRLARTEGVADHRSERALVVAVRALVRQCAAEAGVTASDIHHAVVGVPAVVSPADGSLRLVSGIAGGGRELPSLLARALPSPVTMENDTNLAALAELHYGEGAGTSSFALLSIGAGAGAGIVIGGELFRGFTGGAGEVAYLPAPPGHSPDILGEQSIVLDAYAAGIDSGGVQEIFGRAGTGDERAIGVLDATASRIATAAAAIGFVLDPELIVLGGAVGASGEFLAPLVRRHLEREAPLLSARIVTSSVGPDAVLHGAEASVWQTIREAAFARASSSSQASGVPDQKASRP